MSKTTRSAKAPARTTPRSVRLNVWAARPVIRCIGVLQGEQTDVACVVPDDAGERSEEAGMGSALESGDAVGADHREGVCQHGAHVGFVHAVHDHRRAGVVVEDSAGHLGFVEAPLSGEVGDAVALALGVRRRRADDDVGAVDAAQAAGFAECPVLHERGEDRAAGRVRVRVGPYVDAPSAGRVEQCERLVHEAPVLAPSGFVVGDLHTDSGALADGDGLGHGF